MYCAYALDNHLLHGMNVRSGVNTAMVSCSPQPSEPTPIGEKNGEAQTPVVDANDDCVHPS